MHFMKVSDNYFIVTDDSKDQWVLGHVMLIDNEWRAQPDDMVEPTDKRYASREHAAESLPPRF